MPTTIMQHFQFLDFFAPVIKWMNELISQIYT